MLTDLFFVRIFEQQVSEQQRVSTETLINSIAKNTSGKKSMNSRPFKLTPPKQVQELYDYLTENSPKIRGRDIELKYPNTEKKTLRSQQCKCIKR